MVPLAWLSWVGALLATGVAVADAAPLLRMLAFVATTFFGMKVVVLASARAAGAAPLPPLRLLLFLTWFGMNPRLFARRRAPDPERARQLARRGLRNALAGLLLVLLARAIGATWAALLLMVALSLLVHFGVFTLLTAALVARGFPARVLFDAPWRSRTPGEFWAQRWNRGFSEMTTLAVQRPLAPRLGPERALLASFAVSGLLHEIAISVPVGAGFGMPTLYFVLQGLFARMFGERPARWRTLLLIVLPLPLVFHPWFVVSVFVPLVTG